MCLFLVFEKRKIFTAYDERVKDKTKGDKTMIIGSLKDERNMERINSWIENKQVTNAEDGYGGAIIVANEFKFVMLECRKNFYKQGKILAFAKDLHSPLFVNIWRKNEDFFMGLSDKEIEVRIAYFDYVRQIEKLGRSIEDIIELEPNLIYEIYQLDMPDKYEEIENFVLKNKVGRKYLKRIVEILQENIEIELDVAFEQAKQEAKAKREEIKSLPYQQEKYRKLKLRYKYLLESYNYNKSIWNKGIHDTRINKKRYERLLDENKVLKKEIKMLKKK